MVAAAAVGLVYLSTRSPFDWIRFLPAPVAVRQVTRRLLRSLVFLAAAPVLPAPTWSASALAYGAGALVGAVALASQWGEVSGSLRPERLRLYPPIGAVGRFRDAVHSAVGGGAQEYLYRYVVLTAAAPALGAGAVLLATALFVLEHRLQPGAVWDRKDLAVHASLGLALGAVAYAGGSVWPAVLGHTIYNAPSVVFALRRPGRRAVPAPA
jgi:membrane protease YdiL (CAAX protease family)